MQLDAIEKRLGGFRLRIHRPAQAPLVLGRNGPLVDWYLHDTRSLAAILDAPQQRLAVSYARGAWDMDTDQLPFLIRALMPESRPQSGRARDWLRQMGERLLRRGRKRIATGWQHDNPAIARACLGEEMFQHTAAFDEPGLTLEQAQRLRCRRLIRDLQLQPGQHVLDLDAGWGATALALAEQTGVRVTALFARPAQLDHARREVRRRGLRHLVLCRLGELDQCRGHFDRILAGRLPLAQGRRESGPGLARLGELLLEDGFAWLQLMVRQPGIDISDTWLRAQLGHGAVPLLSQLVSTIETTRMRPLQVEALDAHRDHTLTHWRRRFRQQRSAISRLHGERKARLWEYRLASEQAAMQLGQIGEFQLLLGNPRARWKRTGTDTENLDFTLPVDLSQVLSD